jgi:hypothetical protein
MKPCQDVFCSLVYKDRELRLEGGLISSKPATTFRWKLSAQFRHDLGKF